MSSYTYAALPEEHIRILVLKPNHDHDAPIECNLVEYSLEIPRKHRYEALSYVWGNPAAAKSILLNGFDFPVTTNLHAALSHLRDHTFDRILWVDAICIDQRNDAEKVVQIQSMGRIYSLASRVVVWLGEKSEDSHLAFKCIQDAAGNDPVEHQCLADSKVEVDDNSSSDSSSEEDDDEKRSIKDNSRHKRIDDHHSLPVHAEGYTACMALLKRSWFQRIWVLQEVGTARCVLIQCGRDEMNGSAFCSGLGNLNLTYEEPELQGIIQSATYLIGEACLRPIGMSASNSLSIAQLVDMYHTHQATICHDKIYALLGLCSDDLKEAGLVPDYATPWNDVFRQLIQYILPGAISINTWVDRQVAFIKGKVYSLGRVISVEADGSRYGRQHVGFFFNDMAMSQEYQSRWGKRWRLWASAKAIQKDDILCLVEGSSKPSIIRACNEHYAVVLLEVTAQQRETLLEVDSEDQNDPTENSVYEVILVWNWELCFDNVQKHKALIKLNHIMPDYVDAKPEKSNNRYSDAMIFKGAGLWRQAARALEEATARNPRKDCSGTVERLDQLGLLYMQSAYGRKKVIYRKRAEYTFEKALDIMERLGDFHSPRAWNIRANLASTYLMGYDVSNLETKIRLPKTVRHNLDISEWLLVDIARHCSRKLLKLLFDQQGDRLQITGSVVKAAAANPAREVMELLLDQCGEISVSEDTLILEGTAKNEDPASAGK
ncbi:hypothetical protein ASPWEDRAFT_46662 [Aspergillus wentii DTO 134E9]|uniref:Heterokaryon incompatibility domain-containing protein n=1 Tax=Aspergillus wentii DTO 134E9 TaxID=1073089 RepID=A0A1L9R4T5_ASPWE|nr:uncharacterized protein ASPWEDRAFT_46662 [Aspergillus wentii DTO 134E9]OJJ29918.1 hypothetical protein ASPWEDRAFT_46662 [Aspergillus wentii DTO 134E9]